MTPAGALMRPRMEVPSGSTIAIPRQALST
jgi:hypothetical protein